MTATPPPPLQPNDESPSAFAQGAVAFLDESGSHHAIDPGTYILAAAVCLDDTTELAREQMRRLQLKGQTKLHWRDESPKRRRQVTEAITRIDMLHVVVVRDGATAPDVRLERRRRVCLERMLHELETLGVTQTVFESRGPADDRRDRAMLDALRARHQIGPHLRMNHVRGPHEPALWVPDAICGAVAHARAYDDEYLNLLNREGVSLDIHEIIG